MPPIRRQPVALGNIVNNKKGQSHIWHILVLLLKLKGFKFLSLILVIAAAVSNHLIFPIVDTWMGNYGHTLTKMDANDFIQNSNLMMEVFRYEQQFQKLLGMMGFAVDAKNTLPNFFSNCKDKNDCKQRLLNSLYGRYNTSKYMTYIDYGGGTNLPSVVCQIAAGADLYCPFVGHLAASSANEAVFHSSHTLDRVHFFSLRMRSASRIVSSSVMGTSKCAKHDTFDLVVSKTIMIQTIVLLFAAAFYFTISTIGCIVALKKNGFLKIIFQKGLSVKSYWLAIWLVTMVEALVITLALSMSHLFQCPGFYKITSIMIVLFATFVQLLCIAALAFFFTVLLNEYFHMGLGMALSALTSCLAILIMREIFPAFGWTQVVLLCLLPFGHLVELTVVHLLSVILPSDVSQYHHMILIISVALPIALVALTLYLDYILISGNGYCLDPDYVFRKGFWKFDPNARVVTSNIVLSIEELPEMPCVEPMTEGLQPVVQMKHVGKEYTAGAACSFKALTVVALSDITGHIYRNEITAIIGHNGSGKTTLLNILNGTILPTYGDVSVLGLQVNDSISRMRLRRIVGICPQDNSLSKALTVLQTLQLAQVSCDRSATESKQEIESLLDVLHLSDKKHHFVSRISGGTMRRLCTAVALIGNTKIIFLDEPTSGVDPVSRRRIWKLLQENKMSRSIIMSTQSMDEADTLADRKLFLSNGSIICAGSSIFLKRVFNCGVVFNVTVKETSHAVLLAQQMKKEFFSVRVASHFRNNVEFHLGLEEINALPAFAQALEKRHSMISAYGLLQSSLYDIFVRLADLQPADVDEILKTGQVNILSNTKDLETAKFARINRQLGLKYSTASKHNISRSALRCFRAMIWVNLKRILRSRARLCSRILAPIFLLLALFIMAFFEKSGNNFRLHLHNNLTNFGEAFTKGICVTTEVIGKKTFSEADCASVLRGRQNGTAALGVHAIVLAMQKGASWYEFLQHPEQLKKMQSLCATNHGDDGSSGCPIIYTDKWDTSYKNSERVVAIGSFETFDNFNRSVAASVSIGAYYRLAKHFLSAHISDDRILENAYKYTATTIYDFRSTFVAIYGAFLQLIIIAFLPATFLDDLIEDKETKVRNQLASLGLGPINYWITTFLVHWIQYAVIYLTGVTLLIALNPGGYANAFYPLAIVLPTLVFGLSNNLLTVYILSSMLNKSNPSVTVAYFFFSVSQVILILALQLDNVTGVVLIALIPPFASIALTFYGTKAIFYTMSFYNTERSLDIVQRLLEIYFSQPHILVSFIVAMVHFVLLLLIFSTVEVILGRFMKLVSTMVENPIVDPTDDPDVQMEVMKMDEFPRNEENLVEARHLEMRYPNGTRAVNDLTFATARGEIFGLLGPNGAGKSSTMAIIVGDIQATDGSCEIHPNANWLPSKQAARNGFVGYCPQYNPLYDNLTTRENMEFYACIRGLPEMDSKEDIRLLLQSLDLVSHERKLIRQLSNGCKRRLSLAVSLLGNPHLLVIDEGSTGVDPIGKRVLWQSIRSLANKRHSIIVSTHSMEEAEALCSRIGVMNHGLLIGLGSVQQLKSRYGRSYLLEILIRTERRELLFSIEKKRKEVIKAVLEYFVNCSITEEFTNRVIFTIPTPSIGRLSRALLWLVEAKYALHILHFSFYQMSLDQVFYSMVQLHTQRTFDWDGPQSADSADSAKVSTVSSIDL